jgi:Fur family transcriptional regulator, ferric uptake regulator
VDPRGHETAALRLRRIGQRYTGQRRSLVGILSAADRPLSVPEILKKDRRLAQSSAYRNLAVLERAGVVHRVVATSEFSSFEIAEDLGKHHHHLICSSCGRVEDFTLSGDLERSATSALDRAANRAGYSVNAHRLDVIGLCRTCA